MPITNNVDVTDDLIVNFDKHRKNANFTVKITNSGKRSARLKKISSSLDFVSVLNFNESNSVIKAGNELSYLFEAAYKPQRSQDQNEGKIRFTFKDHTHVTRSIKIVHEKYEEKIANHESIEKIHPPAIAQLTPGLINLQEFIKKALNDSLAKLNGDAVVPIQVSDGLHIEFDHFHSSKSCEIQIRNNTWKMICLESIEFDESKIIMCEDFSDKPMIVGPGHDLYLHFKAHFVPDEYANKTQISFWFGKLCVRRTIKIQYQVRGPKIPRDEYDIPEALKELLASRYRLSRSEYMDALDNCVPSPNIDYAKHFHNLLYLEECGLRNEIKANYLQKEAFFGEQEYSMENGKTIRKKYEPGVYDLKITDLFEIRPSLQAGMKNYKIGV